MAYYVYILQSEKTGRYYVGSAANPEDRLIDHNTTTKGFTARHRPWRLVFAEDRDTRLAAHSTERKIKKWKSRRMIQRLVDRVIDLP